MTSPHGSIWRRVPTRKQLRRSRHSRLPVAQAHAGGLIVPVGQPKPESNSLYAPSPPGVAIRDHPSSL